MSLGDYLRLFRAHKGGVTPWDVEAAAPTLPKGLYRQMEQRYRSMGDDDALRVLAAYFAVPFEDLRWRFDWPRKALSRALVASQRNGQPITLHLWNGASLHGHVRWWDLGAVGLAPLESAPEIVVVQRHAVDRWDPRADEPAEEEEA